MASNVAEGHVAGTAAAAGHAQHAVFPPFDTTHFASQIIWVALTFTVLYFLMSKIALPRVAGILSARKEAIEADLQRAAKLQEDATAAAAEHEKTLVDAKANAQALGREAHAQAAAEAEARRAKLEAELGAKLADAEKQIADKKTAAMANVDNIAVDAAHAILQHITGKKADAKAVAAAVKAAKA